ncbi:MAG: 16S rRNA (guanine(527)-N(7))-methyltransferase RsmG [Bacteroidales bacterium]|nr:16S rRNA (guanine(527)-N(7))-methyltransferase RsmG [Bacteroidales bacterium]
MHLIKKYFPHLNEEQMLMLESLYPIYAEWNRKVNLISRKDIDFFFERHVLHSLSVLKVTGFSPGTRIMDFGTGGGFPGIPLAIACPACSFWLVDSIGKKIAVIKDVVAKLGLQNVQAMQTRGEALTEQFDFVVSRAVKSLPVFMLWVRDKISDHHRNDLANGVLYLKGGDVAQELAGLGEGYRIFPLSDYFSEPYFNTKKIVYLYKKNINIT